MYLMTFKTRKVICLSISYRMINIINSTSFSYVREKFRNQLPIDSSEAFNILLAVYTHKLHPFSVALILHRNIGNI